MLLSFGQLCILFAAVFITSYLLSILVDFESDGRGVHLPKAVSCILFPFYKKDRFNIASVVLQISNYLFVVLYILSYAYSSAVNEFVQAIFAAVYLVLTIVTTLIFERCMVIRNKIKKG